MSDARDALAGALADRYLLEEELGRGSSATVYLAQDLRHGRRVALKVLHAALGAALGAERFQREIRTQARLHHPHILPLFDSGIAGGQLFYTMPYVETGSLRDRLAHHGPLPLETVTRWADQVASALAYSHALGIVHRDLKPENILLSDAGHALLADFGIATTIAGGDAADRLTETGTALGTPVYMSPEQAAGEDDLDGRTDQYALAAVVFEALAGATPFTGRNARAILTKKLTERAPGIRSLRPEIPPATERALSQALSPHRGDRFDTVQAFVQALQPTSLSSALSTRPSRRARRIAGPLAALALLAGAGVMLRSVGRLPSLAAPTGAREPRVLAVLPFKNLGPAEDQYFADGLAEEITGRLASLSGLRVISRTSADQYRGSPKPLKTIGAELGVGYLLEGSVRWERGTTGAGRIRVTPQLIRVADDSHLWADTYEGELTAVFQVQADIAERVTTALDVALREPEHAALSEAGAPNAEAYDFYLRGNQYMARGNERTDLLAAIDLYRRAIALDSTFAPAYAKLAREEAGMYWFYYDHTGARLDRAKRAAETALRLAPDLPEARVALGYYYYWGFLDYQRALEEFEVARRLQPSNSDVLGAIGYVERRRGNWEASVARLREASEYDPRSQGRAFDLGDTYLSLRRYPEAERQFDRAIQLAPDWGKPYAYKAVLYLVWRGDRPRARAVVGQAISRVSAGRLARALLVADGLSASVITADSIFNPAVDAVRADAFEGDTAEYYLFKAEAAHFRRNRGEEKLYADSARRYLEPRLSAQPDDPKRLIHLALAYGRAGRKGEAIRAGRRAAELLPPSLDAASGPSIMTYLAVIYSVVGEADRALDLLEQLLKIPSWVSRKEISSDPIWTPLRGSARFQSLTGRPE